MIPLEVSWDNELNELSGVPAIFSKDPIVNVGNSIIRLRRGDLHQSVCFWERWKRERVLSFISGILELLQGGLGGVQLRKL